MYEEHIRAAARSMAENMQRSPVPMYGKGLRLPDKGAVIGLLKEIRRLVFPAYYGDPELMTLPVEDYTALLLERIEGQLAVRSLWPCRRSRSSVRRCWPVRWWRLCPACSGCC